MKLTIQEIGLAFAFAVIGFIFSSRSTIMFLNGLSPMQGLIVYYIILYVSLYMLSRLDLVVFGFKIKDPMQTIGLLMITFAFFICVNWENPYVQLVTKGNVENVSPVFFQAEDGAVWFVWQSLFPSLDIETLRLLTFVVTPFALTLIGGFLVSEKIRLG